MELATSLSEIEGYLTRKQPLLLYFSSEKCGVCQVLKPKVTEEVSSRFPKIVLREVLAGAHPEIAGKFTVFTASTIIVFFDGKEYLRESRNLSVPRFIEQLHRIYSLWEANGSN
ncbi:MAG: thiol reductase thioredoxin [Flavobacteriaceae bacterium]|nr:thiol reductase thioredoxin [Flavobacteriaceae bacterium]